MSEVELISCCGTHSTCKRKAVLVLENTIFRLFTRFSFKNRLFAGSSHMARNKLRWDANGAVGLPKQKKFYQPSPTFLCFESPTAPFAPQRNLFRTM